MSQADDGFTALVRAHQQPLRLFLRRLCGNAAEADDLAQETFVWAWEHLDRLEPGRPTRPWLFGVGWRKYRQSRRGWIRRMMRERRHVEAQPESECADPGLRHDLAKLLAGLPPDQRAALVLCLACDFTQTEAALALDLPLGTVKSHITRGREKLAVLMGGTP